MEPSGSDTKISFPQDFLLGAASAAHQVEGNNTNSDWWHAEQQGQVPKSGEAADHYNRFDEDFQIAQDMGLNAMRISIEWARIEPSPGKWNTQAVEHYKAVLESMKRHGLKRVVTLWHWTLPNWAAEQGGFENQQTVEAFARYVWFVAQNLGTEIDLWLTLNEPEVYILLAYERGQHPPFVKSWQTGRAVLQNLIKAHQAAYTAIKTALPQAQVGVAKNSPYFAPYRAGNLLDRLVVWIAQRYNFYFLNQVKSNLDFIGLNYYNYFRLKFSFRRGYIDMNQPVADEVEQSDMGWFLYPQGIEPVLNQLKRFRKPIYITESGIADAADDRRPHYIQQTLQSVQGAIKYGADVKGFLYWALTDNYEWAHGFGPRFGLVEIDYATQKRTVRPSAAIFKEIKLI